MSRPCFPFRLNAASLGGILALAMALGAGLMVAAENEAKIASDASPITRADVQHLLATELPGWRRALPPKHPRTFMDSAAWAALPARVAASQDREHRLFATIAEAAAALLRQPLPVYRPPEAWVSPRFTLHQAVQENWERAVGDQLVLLSFAARLHGDPAVKSRLRETVLVACRFPTWGVVPQPNSDLACAHVARGVALAYDWNPDLWTADERELIRRTIRERVGGLMRGLYGAAYWSTQYTSNHNHVSAAGLGLCGAVFLDEVPEAAEWLGAADLDMLQAVRRGNADGGSIEGLSYWTYGLSFILQFVEGVRPLIPPGQFYESSYLRAAARFRLANSTPGFGATLGYGESPGADFEGPQHLLRKLGSVYRDANAQYVADHLPFSPRGTREGDVLVWEALWSDPSLPSVAPTALDYHLGDTGLTTSRSGWSDRDYMVAIKSGHTDGGHSHLDAGALTFAIGDEWLIRAPGYGSMQGKAGFRDRSGPRWDYFSNSTQAESTLLVDGGNQRFDPAAHGEVDAFSSGHDWALIDENLLPAYAGMTAVRRQVVHRRGDYIVVFDSARANVAREVAWLVQATPDSAIGGEGALNLSGRNGSLRVEMIAPHLAFSERTATSKFHNVAPNRLRTFAATQRGPAVSFLAFLTPGMTTVPQSTFVASRIEGDDQAGSRVRGAGWDDDVLFARSPGQAQWLHAAGGRAYATAFACRAVPGRGNVSCVAEAATSVEMGDWTLRSVAPTTLQLERCSGNLWLGSVMDPKAILALDPGSGWRIEFLSPAETGGTCGFFVYRGEAESARSAARLGWKTFFP